MSIWSRFFSSQSPQGHASPENWQLPSPMVAPDFGEVNVRREGNQLEVSFTALLEPTSGTVVGWQTGVALDASRSMLGAYGLGLVPGPAGPAPDELLARYSLPASAGESSTGPDLTVEGRDELTRLGHYLTTTNDVEPLARRFSAYLAENLDTDRRTTLLYWAVGDGSAIEDIGDLTDDQCEIQSFPGPSGNAFGARTLLLPAVRYFAERFKDAPNGIYVFFTDGGIDDLDEVSRYSGQLCQEIAAGKRNPSKYVLVGIGSSIHMERLKQLDDLNTGTGIDLWDHKIAKDMRAVVEIFAEVVSDRTIVAPSATIYDARGEVVARFPNGMPARVTFRMPAGSAWFDLKVGESVIRQRVVTTTV